jgi:DNA-binding response OmpR family regulator
MTANVLVVEDDPKIAAMLAKGLRAKGHSVETLATGTEAIARVEQGGIDLQLLDLGLPDIDGLEVLRRLRDSKRQVPVIVITARSDPHDRDTALGLGVVEYLTKPFAWAHLWAAIDTCVSDPD